MSDTPLSPEPAPDQPVAPEHEVVVDLAAFLPEGSSFASGDETEPEGAAVEHEAVAWPAEADDAWPAASADLTDAEDIEDLVTADPDPDPVAESAPEAPKEPPVDLAALGQIEADLGAVDVALLALDQGRYGTCTACDQPIEDELLAADPVRTTCPAHTPG